MTWKHTLSSGSSPLTLALPAVAIQNPDHNPDRAVGERILWPLGETQGGPRVARTNQRSGLTESLPDAAEFGVGRLDAGPFHLSDQGIDEAQLGHNLHVSQMFPGNRNEHVHQHFTIAKSPLRQNTSHNHTQAIFWYTYICCSRPRDIFNLTLSVKETWLPPANHMMLSKAFCV